jgi:hypothetical protein
MGVAPGEGRPEGHLRARHGRADDKAQERGDRESQKEVEKENWSVKWWFSREIEQKSFPARGRTLSSKMNGPDRGAG